MLDVEVFPGRAQEHHKREYGTRYKDLFAFRSRGCKLRCEREGLDGLMRGRVLVNKTPWHRLVCDCNFGNRKPSRRHGCGQPKRDTTCRWCTPFSPGYMGHCCDLGCHREALQSRYRACFGVS